MNKNVWTFGGTIKLATAGCHFARSHSGPALFTPTHLSSRMPLATRGLAVILDSWLHMIELPTLKKMDIFASLMSFCEIFSRLLNWLLWFFSLLPEVELSHPPTHRVFESFDSPSFQKSISWTHVSPTLRAAAWFSHSVSGAELLFRTVCLSVELPVGEKILKKGRSSNLRSHSDVSHSTARTIYQMGPFGCGRNCGWSAACAPMLHLLMVLLLVIAVKY